MSFGDVYKKMMLLAATVFFLTAAAQITPVRLQEFITTQKNTFSDEVVLFYKKINYATAWIEKKDSLNRQIFFNALSLAGGFGLQQTDYQYNLIASFHQKPNLQNVQDSLNAEVLITGAALHFYSNIAYGNTQPIFGYDGLQYRPTCSSIAALLAEYVSTNILQLLITKLSPAIAEVTVLENKIQQLQKQIKVENFSEVHIVSAKVSAGNNALLVKLYQLGIAASATNIVADTMVKQKLKEAQRQFNLPADGVLRNAVLKELNVPVATRIQQLNKAVNYYRWLNCLVQNEPVIVVNIPAALLKVYQKDKVLIAMRIIVGKKATTTPTLTSRVNDVILYPYWHVPHSIAVKELLPAIKRNPGFIDAGNYQVLNAAGRIVDPYAVNWHALSTVNFPYLLRQSTGCDNALGLLKLNFYNPFSVYLHDTPNKNLFSLNKRYFSHGCMRMQKPLELGHLVLKNNAIAIDTLEQKGCLRNQAPITVKADVKMPVIVWYNPAGIDETGRVIFYEDVYDKFNWAKK